MTNITADRLIEIAKFTDALPEKYQVAAFREMVRHELDGRTHGKSTTQANIKGQKASDDVGTAVDSQPAWFETVMERLPEPHDVATGNRNLQAAWAVVELNNRKEPATPAAIERLIREELGVAPEDKANLSRRLGKDFTPRYTTRRKVDKGQGFSYEATRAISDLFPENKSTE